MIVGAMVDVVHDEVEHLREVLAEVADPATFMANLLARSPIGYLIYDTDGRPVAWNGATAELLGGEPVPEYRLFDDPVAQRTGGVAAFQGALAGATTRSPVVWWDPRQAAIEQSLPEEILPPSKRIAMQVTFFPLHDRSGTVRHVVQTYNDLTELMQHRERLEEVVEQRMIELRSALEEVERLYTESRELDRLKSELTANVSHELRTPLTLILGPAQQLIESPGLSPDDRARAHVVRRNAQQLLARVNDLLDTARFEAGRAKLLYAEVDLDALLGVTADSFASLAQERGLRFGVESGVGVPVELDADLVQRVIMNLLANAFKFTPAGGTVVLRGRRDEAAGSIVIEVCDTGIGIPAQDRERVFDRYRQAERGDFRRFGGTGLGLSIARDIVLLHGGEIGVAADSGPGTTIRVQLPMRAPAGASPQPRRGVPHSPDAELIATTVPTTRTAGLAAPSPRDEQDDRPLVLVVEDNPDMNAYVVEVLADLFRTVSANDGREGLRAARSAQPDLVITDAMMPGMSGEAFLRELRSDEWFAAVPVLMLTAKADAGFQARMLQSGANDFLGKPFAPEVLRARVSALLRAKASGDLQRRRLESLSRSEAEARAQLRWRSLHDDTTGLPRRELLIRRLEELLAEGVGVGVAVLDLDQFKIVSGTYGHDTAQALLVEVSRRLGADVRHNEMVANLGGDMFALTETGATTDDALQSFAKRLARTVSDQPFRIGDREIGVSCSVGLASTGMGLDTAEALVRAAGVAVDRAKTLGRNRFDLYDVSFTRDAAARLQADADVRAALSNGWLKVHYQPIIDVTQGRTWGCEALARIAHPRGDLIMPESFIDAVEGSGLVVPLGRNVLQSACRQLAAWHETSPDLLMTVNLSGRQAREPDLLRVVDDAIADTGVPPHRLCLEITEGSVVGSSSRALTTLQQVRERGVHLSVDDFGTRYNSLAYVHDFPVDTIKIDKSFVADLATDRHSRAITSAILALGESLELDVVAEGVETAEQLEILTELGAHLLQGYHFARPAPPDQVVLDPRD